MFVEDERGSFIIRGLGRVFGRSSRLGRFLILGISFV